MAVGQDYATPTTVAEAQTLRQLARGQIQQITAQLHMYEGLVRRGNKLPHWMARPLWESSARGALRAKERRAEYLNRWILNRVRVHGIPEDRVEEADPTDTFQMLAACWTFLRALGTTGAWDSGTALGYADEIRNHLRFKAPQYAERMFFMSIMDGSWVHAGR